MCCTSSSLYPNSFGAIAGSFRPTPTPYSCTANRVGRCQEFHRCVELRDALSEATGRNGHAAPALFHGPQLGLTAARKHCFRCRQPRSDTDTQLTWRPLRCNHPCTNASQHCTVMPQSVLSQGLRPAGTAARVARRHHIMSRRSLERLPSQDGSQRETSRELAALRCNTRGTRTSKRVGQTLCRGSQGQTPRSPIRRRQSPGRSTRTTRIPTRDTTRIRRGLNLASNKSSCSQDPQPTGSRRDQGRRKGRSRPTRHTDRTGPVGGRSVNIQCGCGTYQHSCCDGEGEGVESLPPVWWAARGGGY